MSGFGPIGSSGSGGGGGGASSGYSKLTGDIVLYVTDAGSDNNPARTETQGDLIDKPFETVAGARAYLDDLGGFRATIISTRTGAQSPRLTGLKNGTLELQDVVLGHEASIESLDLCILTDCTLTGTLDILYSNVSVTATMEDEGCIDMIGGEESTFFLTASECVNTVLTVRNSGYVGYEIDANDCEGSIVDFAAVMYSELIGGGLTGTNAAAPSVVRLARGGKHALTGASATCSGAELDLDGYGVTWATLSSENHENGGTFAFWADNRWVRMGRMRIVNNSSTPFDDLIVSSLQYGEYMKQYGVDRPLDPAYKEVTAFATGGQASATLVARQDTLIATCATAGDSVRLLSDLDAPAMGGGAKGSIWNRGAASANVFPPTGKQIYLAGVAQGNNTAIALGVGKTARWMCDNNNDYNVIID